MLRLGLSIIALLGFLSTGAQATLPGLTLGFYDGVFSTADRQTWLAKASAVDAQILRVDIGWPAHRAPVDPSDPADPAYSFSSADASIQAIAQSGAEVDLSFTGAPAWAEGDNRPSSAQPGSWKPRPEALRGYGIALGRRYSGTFPDPAHDGQMLPRVRYFQLWNEPNLSKYLSPQWDGVRPYSPGHYRRMINAFAAGLKSVRPDAKVVTAGTAPFGDNPGGQRVRPLEFWRVFLRKPARFDVASHHPYGVAVPTRPAINADDITVPDLGKLRKLLDAEGEQRPLWVTEVSYDSSPPDPDGVPVARHARWLSQTLYLLWHARVSTVLWYLIRDNPPIPSYPETNQAGVFYLDGRAKPAARAFRFPFVVVPQRRNGPMAWVRAPVAGRLIIERLGGARPTPVASRRVAAREIVTVRLAADMRSRYRARIGTDSSLPFAASQFGH